MNRKHIIIGLLIVLVIIYLSQTQKRENLDAPNLSNEAIQNIASVYANTSGEAVFNKIKVTGTSNLVPRGTIVAWNPPDGKLDKAPDTWAFCDGTNGTPNLRGRFILGNGKGTDLTERKLNDNGGTENHTLTIEEMTPHTHLYAILTGREDGAHAKQDTAYTDESTNKRKGFGGIGELYSLDASNQAGGRYYNYTSISGGILDNQEKKNELTSHKAKPHNNMPPFYVLAYIMKL